MLDRKFYTAPRQEGLTGWGIMLLAVLLGLGVDTWDLWFTPTESTPLPGRLAVAAVVLLIVTVIAAANTGNSCGRTTIDSSGVTVRTLLLRRFVPWAWITSFEVVDIGPGASHMYALCANHSSRRVLPLAGVISFKRDDPAFDERIAEIQETWTAATGAKAVVAGDHQ